MATYQATHKESIQSAFQRFHVSNPIVYKMIVTEADRKIREGKNKFSVKEIVNSLRWNKYFETKENNLFEVAGVKKRFKINDIYISRYSRLLITQYPHMAEYIEMRDLRAV